MFVLFKRSKKPDDAALVTALDKSQAIIEFGPDGAILTANKNFLDALGYRLDEIVGRHHKMFVEKDSRNTQEYKMSWRKLGRSEFDAGQYLRIGKGGKEVRIEASYNSVFNARGQVYKVVKLTTGISS